MLHRRTILKALGATGLAAGLAHATAADAQTLEKLRILVPAAPGGGWDTTGRTLANVLRAEKVTDAIQVINIPGAGGTVALPQFVNSWRSQGDALMVSGSTMISAAITNKSPVDLSMATPIARLTGEVVVIAVPAASPYKDFAALAAAFKAKPEAISFAGGSVGSGDHIVTALLSTALGVEPGRVNFVPFSGGGEAVAALLGGHVSAGLSGWSEFAEHFRSGKLRALAVTAEGPMPGIDAPTLRSLGQDVVFYGWRSVFATPGISGGDRAKLLAAVERAARSEAWKAELAKHAWLDLYLSGDAFGVYVAEEIKRTRTVLSQLKLG